MSTVFVWDFKFKNRQLDRKTFEVDKWVSLEFPARQRLKLRQLRYQSTFVIIVSCENILIGEQFHCKFNQHLLHNWRLLSNQLL